MGRPQSPAAAKAPLVRICAGPRFDLVGKPAPSSLGRVTMSVVSEAHQKALEARTTMLDARPRDTIPPLPDTTVADAANCAQYFQIAGDLYALAARAYADGDVITGHTYELWAFQHLALGQACEEATAPASG
jgi:hypothetical protein